MTLPSTGLRFEDRRETIHKEAAVTGRCNQRLSGARHGCRMALLVVIGLTVLGFQTTHAASTITVLDPQGTPVKLEQVKLLNTDATPMVLLYGAVNQTANQVDQFTVTVLVFDKDKRLKARQVAPGRRTLEVKETKFSAMVLDVGTIDAADSLVVGVDQAQAAGSDDWWRADLRTLAENLMKSATAPAGR